MLPIWLIYFMPLFMLGVLVVRGVGVGAAVVILAVLLKLSELCRTELFLKGLLFGFLGDLAGLAVFAAVFFLGTEGYTNRYPLVCAASFAVAVILQFLLHCWFGFKKCDCSVKRRIWISATVAAAAAPYFFFIPE